MSDHLTPDEINELIDEIGGREWAEIQTVSLGDCWYYVTKTGEAVYGRNSWWIRWGSHLLIEYEPPAHLVNQFVEPEPVPDERGPEPTSLGGAGGPDRAAETRVPAAGRPAEAGPQAGERPSQARESEGPEGQFWPI